MLCSALHSLPTANDCPSYMLLIHDHIKRNLRHLACNCLSMCISDTSCCAPRHQATQRAARQRDVRSHRRLWSGKVLGQHFQHSYHVDPRCGHTALHVPIHAADWARQPCHRHVRRWHHHATGTCSNKAMHVAGCARWHPALLLLLLLVGHLCKVLLSYTDRFTCTCVCVCVCV